MAKAVLEAPAARTMIEGRGDEQDTRMDKTDEGMESDYPPC